MSVSINQHVVQFREPIKSRHAQNQVNVGMSLKSGLKSTNVVFTDGATSQLESIFVLL